MQKLKDYNAGLSMLRNLYLSESRRPTRTLATCAEILVKLSPEQFLQSDISPFDLFAIRRLLSR